MRAILLIIFILISFTGFAQVKKDSSSDAIYMRSTKSSDSALANYRLLKDNTKAIDSTYIKIYHSKDYADTGFPPAYFIDSVRAQSMSYLNPKDILDIKVVGGKDSVNKTNGKIYITLKKHPYHFITIEELTKRCIPNFDSKTQPVIYMWDDKLVTDTTNMKFEITYIRDVEVIEGSQIKAFKGLLAGVIILKINTNDAPIYLRGNTTPVSFKQ